MSIKDTEIPAYLKASPPLKVRLSSEEISPETFATNGACPVAGQKTGKN